MTFRPGKSGNPSGRPRGIRNWRTAIIRQLEPHGHELIDNALAAAQAGDRVALVALLDLWRVALDLAPRTRPTTEG